MRRARKRDAIGQDGAPPREPDPAPKSGGARNRQNAPDGTLDQRNRWLAGLNDLAIELASVPSAAVPATLARRLVAMTGAVVAGVTRYDPGRRVLVPCHLEIEPGLVEKLYRLLGRPLAEVHSPVGEEMYRRMVGTIVTTMPTLTEITFGAVPRAIGAAVQKGLGIDRFTGLAYVVEGELYGTTVMGLRREAPDAPADLLLSFAHMAAVSLRRCVAEEALRESERKFLALAEQERRRIGRDMHDVLGQELTGAAMLSEALEKRLAGSAASEAPKAAQITKILYEATGRVRRLAKGLCPVEAAPDGLVKALGELASGAGSLFRISCRFRTSGRPLIHDGQVAEHLYHIAQEAITNSVKHGGAKNVEILLRSARDGLTLSIRDDGAGFPERASEGPGLGLRIMRDRTRMMRGIFDARNAPGGGAVVTCRVPADAGVRPEAE